MTTILVYAEMAGNEVTDVSLQCCAKARELAAETGATVQGVVMGSDVTKACEQLARHGLDKIWTATAPWLKDYAVAAYQAVLADLVRACSPQVVLFPSSTQGNDLAATCAASLGDACVTECRDIRYADGSLILKRMEFDGKVLTSFVAQEGARVVATLKDGCAEVCEDRRAAEVAELAVPSHDCERAACVISQELAKKTVDLKAAKVIVTAGAGVGSRENFKIVEDLAAVLGAEVGATRPVVDAGWASPDRQVGQTGATVKPDLYIACGVSGAVQHRVGMEDAKTIVAINSDASAPIFKIAHYGIVGDLNTVVPKLQKLVRS